MRIVLINLSSLTEIDKTAPYLCPCNQMIAGIFYMAKKTNKN